MEMNETEFAVYQKDEVAAVKKTVTMATNIPAAFKFLNRLQFNDKSNDVKYLQIFLKSQGLGIYPEGITSGWFGSLTKKAVIRFQETHMEDILTPWGFLKGTGIIGKTTMQKINELLGR